jgi:outer membrane protein assembly factor BamB
MKNFPLRLLRLSMSLVACGSFSLPGLAANWPNWRGPEENASTSSGTYPTALDPARVQWQVALPGKGCSTPIVWNDRIYVTAPVGGKDALLALDWSGQRLWQTSLGPEAPGRHRNGSGSNPSPVCDGSGIFVTFKSGQLAAVNLDGSIRWQLNLMEKFGPVKLVWDYGSSPALASDSVVIARMHRGESWVAAFDKRTGAQRWLTPRTHATPSENDNGYTTPLVIEHAGRQAVLVWGAERLTLYDAGDGALLWTCGNFNPAGTPNLPAVATPVVAGGFAVVPFGRADRGAPQLHGIRLGGKGDVTETHRAWKRTDAGAFVPSPAAYKGRVYLLSDRGQIDCVEPATGQTEWSEALPRSSSNYYASPMIANGLMYAVREDGGVFVAQVEGGYKLLSENKFPDRIIASVVPSGGRLLVRGESNLYCLATAK